MAENYTFKKLSNDPLSKNSVRIIIGLPMNFKKQLDRDVASSD